MENRQQIQEELKEITPFLAEMEVVNPYTAPTGYFNTLADRVMDRIEMDKTLQPASQNIYDVPAGYFEGLPAAILSRVQQSNVVNEVWTELEEIAPLLNTISKQEVYAVPAGYFGQANFAGAAQSQKTTGKVISLKIARKWMQYAAAAVVTGVLVTGAFLYTDNNPNFEYEKYSSIDVSSEINKASEEDMESYLDKHEHFVIAPETTVVAVEDFSDASEPIEVLSDEELSQYLKENAEPLATGITRTSE